MPMFKLNYGSSFMFMGQTAGEVVPILHSRHMTGCNDSEDDFLHRLATELAEWSGEYFCYSSRECLAESMVRHGLLEVVD